MTANAEDTDSVCTGWKNSSCEGTEHCPPRCPRFFDDDGTARIARRFEPTDFDAVVDMYDDLDAYSRTQGIPPTTRSKIIDWIESLFEEGWNLVVDGDGEQIIAHTAAIPDSAPRPELVIFVHQSVRNRGIGTELLKHLVAHAGAREHEGLKLHVSRGNKHAITVYENIGFDVAKREASDLEMELPMSHPIADRVQLPPAEREE
ncbi:GNAT family N-acetyltransferase [Halobacterium noricense]|uniref:GNAT family N-acetyltransferase n=1 Tax=Halobacterium noricense TaxID=223182 RepID=UPI001E4A31ED|nr:GNAT family N-acetyltransferase [Halobacterium noricense]UHH23968.1 GNAT family N-acetyltransferase [Halobacterium noricense]